MKEGVASSTSLSVALVILLLGGDTYGRSWLPTGCLEAQISLLRAADLPFGRQWWLLCNPILAKLTRWTVMLFQPKFLEGIGYRKMWIEEQVREAIDDTGKKTDDPATQVLVVASGYDTLALRLADEYPRVNFVEVDHPDTLQVKRRALDRLGGGPSNLRTLPADLTKMKLTEALPQLKGYVPKLRTVIVIEGLLFYLTPEHVQELLLDLAAVSGPSSLLAMDYFGRRSDGQPDLGISPQAALNKFRRLAEPILWTIQPQALASFVESTPWRLDRQGDAIGWERLARLRKTT